MRHELRIERDVITTLLASHGDKQEYFFSVPSNTQTLTLRDLHLIGSGTGTHDEHDSTIDAAQLCGHTHPNVEGRFISPPSSYDVHSLTRAMKRGIESEDQKTICCSHLVVAPKNLYMLTVHPVWAMQPIVKIDWTLQERYQSFDALLGGVEETRHRPCLTLSQYKNMTERMGIPVQVVDARDSGQDVVFDVYTVESAHIGWSSMDPSSPLQQPPVPERPDPRNQTTVCRRLQF